MSHHQGWYLKYLIIPVGLLVMLTGFYLAYDTKQRNDNEIRQATQHAAELIRVQAENTLSLYFSAIERMGKRWEDAQGPSYTTWEKDAEAYIRDMPIFKAILWIDSDFKPQWSTATQKNKAPINANLKYSPRIKNFFLQAKNSNQTVIAPILATGKQSDDYLILFPLYYDRTFHGFIAGIFPGKVLFQTLLKKELTENFFIKVTQGAQVILPSHLMSNPDELSEFEHSIFLKTYNLNWKITLSPSKKTLRRLSSSVPFMLASGSTLLGILFSLLLYLLTQRAKMVRVAVEAKEKIDKATEETRLILEKASEGFISVDEQSRIIHWNPYASILFGWKREEVLNKPLQDFIIPPQYREMHLKGMKKFLETGKGPVLNQTIEVTACHRTKGEFPIELTVFPVRSSGQYTFHAFLRDISDRKNIEKMKNEFISLVSHELRTPLTAIKGSIDLLLGLKSTSLPEKQLQLLAIAQQNCDRLIRLINDILDIEKIEAGKVVLNHSQFNLSDLIQEAVHANEGYANAFQVELILKNTLDIQMVGDRDKLMQVLTNLISNAVKFSKPHQQVIIQLTAKPKTLEIAVQDQGVGIPQKFQDKIFEKFTQSDSTTSRSNGGTGLGLSISKAIVEMHNGSIHFSSEEGSGTTFYIELPRNISKKHIQKSKSSAKKVAKTGEPKILICEDDKTCANLLRMMLEEQNFAVDIAYTAQEARQLLRDNQYELMTLDLMLPDQNGISFIKEIQQSGDKTLPIIVISAIVPVGQQELNGNAFPVIGWIEKPIHQEQLSSLLKKAVKNHPKKKKKILHIEDDPDLLKFSKLLFSPDATILTAQTLAEARKILKQHTFDVVILDLELPDGNAAKLLPIINEKTQQMIPVVIFSAYEMEEKYAKYVSEHLKKTGTSNEKLIATIHAVINKANA